jgi:hypothetical protein
MHGYDSGGLKRPNAEVVSGDIKKRTQADMVFNYLKIAPAKPMHHLHGKARR